MTVLLASNNDHKRKELARILNGHRIVLPRELGIDFEFEETAETFLENSLGKARALREMLRQQGEDAVAGEEVVVIADDSGLCVAALDGRPGVYSARYGSPDGGKTELASDARNRMLLDELGEAPDRSAHFVCCMVAVFADDRFAVMQETFEGVIAREPAGAGGFGYDPVFFLPERGVTVAELAEDEKNRISHRGKAAARLATILAGT